MSLFARLCKSIADHPSHRAFCIGNVFYSYSDFSSKINSVRQQLRSLGETQTAIGVTANDDIETYATILACWFEGKAYVPLSPTFPRERTQEMIRLSGLKTIFDSNGGAGTNASGRSSITSAAAVGDLAESKEDQPAYILFTSGSTGTPKTVPVSIGNLSAFVDAVDALGMELNEQDRWLQMFDLTFDLSLFSFLIPLLKGACVYTVPGAGVKNLQIFRLLDEHRLTVTLMVPSVLQFFRSYFEEIDIPDLRYSLFCGEALPLDLVEGWSKSAGNAQILNVYGPSEATIFCSSYSYNRHADNKSAQGILSIGRAMKGTVTCLVDERLDMVGSGRTGELCLSGPQVIRGYLHNEKRNSQAFFSPDKENESRRYYRSGDLCIQDQEGDLMFIGRADTQVKVQGFRIELGEIEQHVRTWFGSRNVVALAAKEGLTPGQIVVVIEGAPAPTTDMLDYLKQKLPSYMIPGRFEFIARFPLNSNGKTDRLSLSNQLAPF